MATCYVERLARGSRRAPHHGGRGIGHRRGRSGPREGTITCRIMNDTSARPAKRQMVYDVPLECPRREQAYEPAW